MSEPLAHSGGHPLAAHLQSVAQMAARFAASFDTGGSSQRWAGLAGLWHDLGKYRTGFQRYLQQTDDPDAHIEGKVGGPDKTHSAAGALWAIQHLGERHGEAGARAARVLAYLIAGHHAGLADWHGGLAARLEEPASRRELQETLAAQPPADILEASNFAPNLRQIPGSSAGFALWLRMLFSCLVDADFLDTEAHFDAVQTIRRTGFPTLAELRPAFDAYMASKAAQAGTTPSTVNALRADILRQCLTKASTAPGLFSLTVPTGGGKTLSSMAFALEHATQHDKRRILYVIPYTSIIEQTADIFRGIFGEAVIEHHSNAESEPDQENSRSRLACENWDAPIVVTTNVQFFESLFAARTSRCRKLHNIAGSIVVLDEAQLLPPEFLQPILDVLNLLTRHYGVTVVLCTATQPALSTWEYFDAKHKLRGLENVREIITDPDDLYRKLERVRVHLPADWQQPTDWDTLAHELAGHESVLTIVNRRQDARELWQRMPAGTLHLSALMCGAHRSRVIQDIKDRLKAGVPTRVVSTQLVEAGVDVDFPVVYRALAGLDSIAQAAGRCNREGRLDKGEMVIFVPPKPAPPGLLRKGENACRNVLHGHAGNPLQRALFDRYFEQLYHACELDEQRITELLKVDGKTLAINFRTAAEKFQLIRDDASASVIVLYRDTSDEIDKWITTLRADGPQRWLMRKLQRYTVNIPKRSAEKMLAQGSLTLPIPGLYLQNVEGLYDPLLGLLVEEVPFTPEGMVL